MKLPTASTLLCALSTLLHLSYASGTFSPARPPAAPLMVKSPYMNSWVEFRNNISDSSKGNSLVGQWNKLWYDTILGMVGLVMVDGEPWAWMGWPRAADGVAILQGAEQTAFEYTSTKSIFTFDVGGKINLTATFLSPLTPHDLRRQSLVMSYLHVEVVSSDGKAHNVSVYADISAEWVSGNRSAVAKWDYGVTNDSIAYHRVYRQEQLAFTEINQQAEWGYWYWATQDTKNVTYQSGQDTVVRAVFEKNGALPNTKDTKFRAIKDRFPVFGFAVNYGEVLATPQETVFVLGLTQEYAIQFAGKDGTVALPSLWTSYFSSATEALSYFYNDWATALGFSSIFDKKIETDSLATAGPAYQTITSLSARQAFGSLQLVGNDTHPYIFMKEISSNGDIQTVDVLYPLHPLLLYTNPLLLKLALDPLFENQESGRYPNDYSIHDLGTYPNATGHTDGKDEPMPLEECGNMLIMTLAYAQAANDTAYLAQHYPILDQWTQYLISNALIPAMQLSTDDFAGELANQTNLALKGIVAIAAMSRIANLTAHEAAGVRYAGIAEEYMQKWTALSLVPETDDVPEHIALSYNPSTPQSYSLLYNLYPDRLLRLGLVPERIYGLQAAFYAFLSASHTYGIPLDSRNTYTKSDWMIWCAAVAEPGSGTGMGLIGMEGVSGLVGGEGKGKETRDMLIGGVARYINETGSGRALSDFYDVDTGGLAHFSVVFTGRGVVGGHFALLALP
ncbi:putative glutaminase protein [Rutstroemia sp. NJR-2017a WRK4]|nr:putative glutaminase protein [Rutstroemia sp. NJR-2017a WRK4]